MFGLTAEKNGIAISARNVGSFWVSLIVSFWPLATMPETDEALPAMRASAPTTEWRKAVAGEACLGSAARSKARLNAAAVTAEPSLKRRPLRMVKVYVLPSLETAGKPDGSFRNQARALGRGLVRIVEEHQVRHVEHRPAHGVVGERRIDELEVGVREVDAQRAAPRDLGRARLRRCRQATPCLLRRASPLRSPSWQSRARASCTSDSLRQSGPRLRARIRSVTAIRRGSILFSWVKLRCNRNATSAQQSRVRRRAPGGARRRTRAGRPGPARRPRPLSSRR